MKNDKRLPLMGAICGDIIGSCYEFKKTKDYDFDLIPNEARVTDDSVMTCAVADWLMNQNNSLTKVLQNWGQAFPKVGYGHLFFDWIYSPVPMPYNSFGNGSAMRVSPVAWYSDSLHECLQLAEKSAEVSHNHPEGIKGAKAVAAAIYLAKIGTPKEEIKKTISMLYGYDLDCKLDDIRDGYKFNATCQGSVPESIICFLEGTDYESAVRYAVSLGGDADTMACIAGSIAVAYYKEIPDFIFEKCWEIMPVEMQDIVNRFESFVKV